MKTRVLIADDEKAICDLLKSEFDASVYEVDLAYDGLQALQKYNRRPYDAVVLDMNMPRMGGLEVLRQISESAHAPSVIMMTAFGSIDDAVQSMKLKASDYITKPFDAEVLVKKVAQLQKVRQKMHHAAGAKISLPQFIGSSEPIRAINITIEKVKNMGTTVLITGESGTGKGVVARSIHYTSNRAQKPCMHVDCASLPENLIESELFGYEKGAFTGAVSTKKGKFELVEDGTIFLDEISALPPALQSRLLVVLQDKTFEHVGGVEKLPMKGRVIAASNENLEAAVEQGRFRADLYYRLNILRIELPPLRHRKEDIRILAQTFLSRHVASAGKRIDAVDDGVWEALFAYAWPGNVRELENVLESAVVLADGPTLCLKDLPDRITRGAAQAPVVPELFLPRLSLEAQELRTIVAALEKHHGHREKTARELGISRRTLQYKLVKYQLSGRWTG